MAIIVNTEKMGVKRGTKRGSYKRAQMKRETQDSEDINDGMSYEEIAKVLHITPLEVQRIEKIALKKLKLPNATNKEFHKYTENFEHFGSLHALEE